MPGPLYPEDLAIHYRGTNKPYRPSNGTEGMMFEELWCDTCAKDLLWRQTQDGSLGCTIHSAALCFDPGDDEYPSEWTHDAEGQPCCTQYTREDA